MFCGIAFSVMPSTADTPKSKLQTEYALNETLDIPEYEIEYQGEKITAVDYALEYPNGLVRSGRSQKLDLPGLYTVHYSAVKAGRVVKATEKFVVQNTTYSFSQAKSKSAVYYGKNDSYADKAEGFLLIILKKTRW